jgi:hypothetical protein
MRSSLAFLACILPLLGACANRVRLVEEVAEQRAALLATDRVVIELPELAGDGRLVGSLRVERELTERVERVVTQHEERVSWRAERELYELPFGLLCLPLAPLAQVLDPLLGDALPGRPLGRFAGLVLAGLNPALNAEWASAVERRTLGSRAEELGRETRRLLEPLPDRVIQVAFDGGAPVIVRTTAEGRFSVHLLDVARASRDRPTLRSLRVRAPGPEPAERRTRVSARLGRRLRRGLETLTVLDRKSPSAEGLAAAVHGVERLGFADYAAELADDVRLRFGDDPAYVDFFRRSLARKRHPRSLPANAD